MSMKHHSSKDPKQNVERQSDYYKLKTRAVQDLLEANEGNAPEVSEAELQQYRSGGRLKTADWVKVLVIKWWFPASTCFFFIWGLGNYMADLMDMLLVTGIALGVVTEMLTNNVIRFFEKTPGAYSRWMMFPKNKYITFPLNILYAFLVLFLVFSTYNLINMVLVGGPAGAAESVPLGVEPILFGLLYMAFDQLLIELKRFLSRRINQAVDKIVRN